MVEVDDMIVVDMIEEIVTETVEEGKCNLLCFNYSTNYEVWNLLKCEVLTFL